MFDWEIEWELSRTDTTHRNDPNESIGAGIGCVKDPITWEYSLYAPLSVVRCSCLLYIPLVCTHLPQSVEKWVVNNWKAKRNYRWKNPFNCKRTDKGIIAIMSQFGHSFWVKAPLKNTGMGYQSSSLLPFLWLTSQGIVFLCVSDYGLFRSSFWPKTSNGRSNAHSGDERLLIRK